MQPVKPATKLIHPHFDIERDKQIMTNVIVHQDRPCYDFAGDEICFPIAFQIGADNEVLIFFHCDAQYQQQEVKAFLNDSLAGYKTTDSGARELDVSDDSAISRFVEKHLRRASGPVIDGEPSKEATIGWLRDNGYTARIYREGYDRILPDDQEEAAPKLTLTRAESVTITSRRVLYCPETEDCATVVRLAHVRRKETEEERIHYRRAARLSERGRRQTIRFDWDVIARLYDGGAKSIQGGLVNGKPCTEENKSEWLALVPFLEKAFVVGQQFSRTILKNV